VERWVEVTTNFQQSYEFPGSRKKKRQEGSVQEICQELQWERCTTSDLRAIVRWYGTLDCWWYGTSCARMFLGSLVGAD
jgi:hypothetical protein